jgi:chemotaxis protein MotA
MREPRGILSACGLVLGVAVIAAAQLSGGGELRMLAQPTALLVVFGGTAAALMVSFPTRTLGRAVLTALRAFSEAAATPEALVSTFLQLAHKARREGVMALEADIVRAGDAFVARALALASSGLEPDLLRHTLEIDSRTAAERADELAEVFESAAGYAPTLGIVGAVLGLMGVMRHMSSSASLGEGIAAAFVATIYGVGAANLIFFPIATRLRVRARMDALRRAITIDGILALHDRLQPSLVEERLTGYLRQPSGDGRQVAA